MNKNVKRASRIKREREKLSKRVIYNSEAISIPPATRVALMIFAKSSVLLL